MGKIRRKAFNIFYNLVAKHMPRSNAKYSFGSKKIRNYCAINLVKQCGTNVNIEKGAVFGYEIIIGNNSGIGVDCELYGPIEIGNNVLMGPEVIMYTINHEFINKNILIQKQGYKIKEKIIIEDDVWIGRRVIILPGVHIGKGAVIGAGAVVAMDIPPYAVAVGNPVRIIKYRV